MTSSMRERRGRKSQRQSYVERKRQFSDQNLVNKRIVIENFDDLIGCRNVKVSTGLPHLAAKVEATPKEAAIYFAWRFSEVLI